MTNAHVVAGVDDPAGGRGRRHHGRRRSSSTTPTSTSPCSSSTAVRSRCSRSPRPDEPAQPKDPIAILGYPQDGPFDIEAGRIRAKQTLRSPDIYGDGAVIRDVYSIRGLVRPGNSGGPIVDSAGRGGRRGLRGVGDRRRHRLRADRRPGPRARPTRAAPARPSSRPRAARLASGARAAGRSCRLSAFGISRPCSIAFSGGPTCLSFLTPIQPISAVSEEPEHGHDQEGPVQRRGRSRPS